MMVTNDLSERDSQIVELRRKEASLLQNINHLEKSHEQDAMVRMQLGKRLEQVLIEKEEAYEQIENLKVTILIFFRLRTITSFLS
jgi:hypothetical protein